MTDQLQLFDPVAAELGKEAGIAQAVSNKASLLRFLRPKAEAYYKQVRRPISMDDVAQLAVDAGISPHALGNSSGGFFEKSKWERVEIIRSARPWGHGNFIWSHKLKD